MSVKRTAIAACIIVLFAFLPAARAATAGGVMSVLNCKLAHQLKDDPIVHPQEPGAAHSHDFAGSQTTDAFSTYASMTASGSTCPLSKDTAGYWAPSLVAPDGTIVDATTINAYYRSPSGVVVQAFPADLRIIAGGDTLNPPSPTSGDRSLAYQCNGDGKLFAYPPDCSAKGTKVVGSIHFPDCLLIGALDSEDHRSHMTYSAFTGTRCPEGYIQVPRLSVNVRYNIRNGTGYRLSSDHLGDADGQTLHADFWNTWDQATLEFLVARCLNGGLTCKAMTNAKLAVMVG